MDETTKLTGKQKWEKRFNAVKTLHREITKPREIKVLDLLIDKETAKDILLGIKDLDYRPYEYGYNKLLLSDNVLTALSKYKDDPAVIAACDGWEVKDVLDPIRIVRSIHYHDESNEWFMDVKVDHNDLILVDNNACISMYEDFQDTTLFEMIDEQGEEYGKVPLYTYYFVLGELIDMENLDD